MKIKTLNGEKEVNAIYTNYKESQSPVIWVAWADIKPILEEYQSAIENEQCGLSDYNLMIDNQEEMC